MEFDDIIGNGIIRIRLVQRPRTGGWARLEIFLNAEYYRFYIHNKMYLKNFLYLT